MSKLETITIDTPSGSNTMQIGSTNTATINLGVSGDTINVPAGVTIANAGTATGFGEANTPQFFVRKTSSNQTINRATATLCTFNTEDIDTASDFSSNRYTFSTAGKYLITVKIKVDSSNTNDVLGAVVEVRKNGAASDAGSTFVFDHLGAGYISGSERPTQDVQVGGTFIHTFAQNDYIEVFVTQKTGTVSDSAGRINAGDGHNTYFGGYRISA